MRYSPLGLLRSCSAQEIAPACSWSEVSNPRVNALIHCQFLEPTGAGFKIVDWKENGGQQRIKREKVALGNNGDAPTYNCNTKPAKTILMK